MSRKSIGWIVLCGCLIASVIAIVGSGDTMPKTAQAGTQWPQNVRTSAPKPQVAAVAPVAQAASPKQRVATVAQASAPRAQIVRPAELPAAVDPRACQAVADRVVTIEQTIVEQEQSRPMQGLAPVDELVAREYEIDISKCPTDFRAAMWRLITAEDSARIHARMDKTGRAEFALGVLFGLDIQPTEAARARIPDASDRKIVDGQKQDFANIQSALAGLAQVSAKYGVN